MPTDVLERPIQQMLARGARTLETVLARAGSRGAGSLQTTTNEAAYLIAAARLAIEALGTSAGASEKKLLNARVRGLERMTALRKAAEPVLDTGQVCALLGLSRETIRKKVDRKQLLALPKGGDRVFPAFQFKDGDVLPGMAGALAALDSDSPFVALSFLLSKSPAFGGKSACQLLQRGEVEPVMAEARSFLRHGS
ncbi:MAG TPA: helix-turn-helix domain-containing protein [Verrucomicrobiae bacterium]